MALASKVSSIFRSDLFAGKVAVVTGGATGIGRAITEELVHLGCKVVIASRKEDRLKKAAEEINTAVSNGTEPVLPVQCNTRKEDEVRYINAMKRLIGEDRSLADSLAPFCPQKMTLSFIIYYCFYFILLKIRNAFLLVPKIQDS